MSALDIPPHPCHSQLLMTVKDLITRLQALPPTSQVVIREADPS